VTLLVKTFAACNQNITDIFHSAISTFGLVANYTLC